MWTEVSLRLSDDAKSLRLFGVNIIKWSRGRRPFRSNVGKLWRYICFCGALWQTIDNVYAWFRVDYEGWM